MSHLLGWSISALMAERNETKNLSVIPAIDGLFTKREKAMYLDWLDWAIKQKRR